MPAGEGSAYVDLATADGAAVLAIFSGLMSVDDFADVEVFRGVCGFRHWFVKGLLVRHIRVDS